MRNTLNSSLNLMITILCTLILGILPSFIISSFVVILTNATYNDCATSGPFWVLTLFGWLMAGIYLSDN
jgi:hypothetical protein